MPGWTVPTWSRTWATASVLALGAPCSLGDGAIPQKHSSARGLGATPTSARSARRSLKPVCPEGGRCRHGCQAHLSLYLFIYLPPVFERETIM